MSKTILPAAPPPLLAAIPADNLAQLMADRRLMQVNYSRGQVIHFEGDPCHKLEIIVSGEIMIESINETGNTATLRELTSGFILGGNLLFSSRPFYPMTVTAQRDTCMLEMGRDAVFDFCATNKDFLRCFLETISDYTLHLGSKLKQQFERTLRQRIISFLNREFSRQGTMRIKLSTSKTALARELGVQRSSLQRELQKMKHDGLIEYDNKTILILSGKMLDQYKR